MKFEKLIIATANEGKYREFRALSGEMAGEVVFAPEIAGIVVEETGRNYRENAMLKAFAWSEKSGLPCLADDSGLEVEALDGAPGLFSARVVRDKGVSESSWLLSQLEGITNRRARFAASLCLCVPEKFTIITEGYCYGTIAEAPAGKNGFGYDPVFIPDGHEKTFAELSPAIKNNISHRTRAFRKILQALA